MEIRTARYHSGCDRGRWRQWLQAAETTTDPTVSSLGLTADALSQAGGLQCYLDEPYMHTSRLSADRAGQNAPLSVAVGATRRLFSYVAGRHCSELCNIAEAWLHA